jgi:hypothetical protein
MEFMPNDATAWLISLGLHPLDGLRMYKDAKVGYRRPSAETSPTINRPDRLFSNVRVDEAMAAAQGAAAALPLESGTFYTILHPRSGTAIYKMADGTRMLRFTNFDTSNGPDVHVYMVAADDAKNAATAKHAGFVDLA